MNSQQNKEIIFVTGNQNKFQEAQYYLSNHRINMTNIDLPEIQSVHGREVIHAKLQSAMKQIKQPCFVMDSSLVINGLCKQGEGKHFPWALIKDVFENMWDENMCRFVASNNDTNCLWSAIIGYHDGEREHYFESSLTGNIADNPRWEHGYNWDTIFIPRWQPNGASLTFAEMSFEEKQSYALTPDLYRQFREFLEKQ